MKDRSHCRSGGSLPGFSIFVLAAFAGSYAYAEKPFMVVQSFDIPAQSTSDALNAFSKQSGLRLLFSYDAVAGKWAEAVTGSFRPDQVLERLLSGTGLHYEVTEDSVVLIRDEGAGGGPAATKTSTQGSHAGATALRLAQTDQGIQDAESQASKTSVSAEDKDSRLQEIVVTAQKREERLSEVPLSIEVLSGEQLDTSTDQGVTDALREVPSVTLFEGIFGGTSSIAMRGVGGTAFSGSSPVAYYLDSAPFALVKSAIVPDANAYDMERVEVLRGPQGTLYGANAENGVVRIITRDADVRDFDFKTRLSGSGTQHGGENYRGDLALNVPIIEDVLGARLVLGHQELGGWIDRPNNDDGNTTEIDSARLRVRAEPTQNLTLGASTWISRTDFDNPALGDENHFNVDVGDSPGYTNFDVHSFQAAYDFSAFTLTSVTSYLDFENKSTVLFEQFGIPGARFLTLFESEVFSQEVLLNSAAGGRFEWTLGAFYRDGEDRISQALTLPLPPTDYQNTSESYAVFGQIGGHLTRTLEWAAGLRYFHDSVSVGENVSQVVPPAPLVSASDDFSKVTPRLSLTWHPTSDVTVYGSYAQGFRSGFPQDPNVTRLYPQIPSAKPETLHSYEIGAHISALGGRVQIDGAGYYILWDDVQQSISVRTGPGGVDFQTAIVNGESASGIGVDLDVTVKPIDRLLVGVNVGWNDLRVDEDIFSETESGPVRLFAAGDRLNNSPELTPTASIGYSFPLGNAFEGRFNASTRYSDAQKSVGLLGPQSVATSGDSYLISDARLEVHAPKNWTATLFVDNFTDENPILTEYVLKFPSWSTRTRPRTIGLQVEYRFQ